GEVMVASILSQRDIENIADAILAAMARTAGASSPKPPPIPQDLPMPKYEFQKEDASGGSYAASSPAPLDDGAKTILDLCEECGITGEAAVRLADALAPHGLSLRDKFTALASPILPVGWVMVPEREPTDAMIDAAEPWLGGYP